jgi:hypothetical protein
LKGRNASSEDAFWKLWNQRLLDRFATFTEEHQRDPSRCLRAFDNVSALAQGLPRVKPPFPDMVLGVALAKREEKAGNKAAALFHYLRLRKRFPDFELPAGYTTRALFGVFIGAGAEGYEKLYRYALMASRAGVHVPIIRGDMLRSLEDRGVLTEAVERSPFDVCARFWRGLADAPLFNLPNGKSNPEWRSRIDQALEDLNAVIDDGGIGDGLLAVAYETRAKKNWAKIFFTSGGKRQSPEIAQLLLDDLTRATQLQHPEPGRLWIRHELLLRPYKSPEVLIGYLDKAEAGIRDRFQRTKDRTLGKGRPFGCEISPMLLNHFNGLLSDVTRYRSTHYRQMGRLELALRDAKQAMHFGPGEVANLDILLRSYKQLKDRDSMKRVIEEFAGKRDVYFKATIKQFGF